jgi:hypothetical protein
MLLIKLLGIWRILCEFRIRRYALLFKLMLKNDFHRFLNT